ESSRRNHPRSRRGRPDDDRDVDVEYDQSLPPDLWPSSRALGEGSRCETFKVAFAGSLGPSRTDVFAQDDGRSCALEDRAAPAESAPIQKGSTPAWATQPRCGRGR